MDYQRLKSLFISDPSSAINESHKIICSVTNFSSFKDFYNYHLQNSHVSTCQNEWSTPKMSVHCVDCAVDSSSCICLQCFLNGNHQGHEYLISTNGIGNCDCGDTSLWKRSGFCPKHQGIEEDSNPENYIDEKLRTTLTDTIFKASFSAMKHLITDNGTKMSPIIQFLMSFLNFGDGFRRLLSISLTEKVNFEKIMYSIFESNVEFSKILQHFCGLLINDELFKTNFSKLNYKMMIDKILPFTIDNLGFRASNKSIEVWNSFWFHCYGPSESRRNIRKFGWKWNEFGIQAATELKEVLSFTESMRFKEFVPGFFTDIVDLKAASDCQPNEETQELFDRLFSDVLAEGTKKGVENGVNNTIMLCSFSENRHTWNYLPLFYFNMTFYKIFSSFKDKKNLKFDKMFIQLERTVNINQIYLIGYNTVGSNDENENDKFVSKLLKHPDYENLDIPENNFKSFRKGAYFYSCFPMYNGFVNLLRNDNLCRVKIAQFLSKEKYQKLRIQLGIITLKNLLAMICFNESLVPRSNEGINRLFTLYVKTPSLFSNGIPLLFPAFQLLIGLQCNEKTQVSEFSLKEFFAFEMAREIGIFDVFDEDDNENIVEIQKQMTFAFLYASILLVIERDLFNFDGYKFIEQQIILALKSGVSDLNKVKDLFDDDSTPTGHKVSTFNKIFSGVATVRQKAKTSDNVNNDNNNSDVSFVLKEGIECKNISAINSFNQLKNLMNNEISKHPENLLQIPSFEPEETFFFHSNNNENDEEIDSSDLNIRLKEFLMTPTVLAIVYQTLRYENESESPNIVLNDHLAMNILILISKFLQETEDDSNSLDESKVILYNSNLADLIAQIKRVVFDFKVDSDENATIKNTLTKKAFNSFLKIKIGSNSREPKSFVDILLEKGEIGKNVLSQMSIEIQNLDNQNNKEDINKMKKLRAQKLKENIMNHFHSITSNFNLNDDQNEDAITPSNTSEKETCSICSNSRKKEVLSYPLYIYRTKFPFIIDKPPLIEIPLKRAIREREVHEDDYYESIKIDDENQNEEEEIVDPETRFAQILSQSPMLDINDELSEEEVQQRRLLQEFIHSRIVQKYEEMMQKLAERKKQREDKFALKIQREKEEALRKEKELQEPDKLVAKRCTPGNIFVIQFGICQHLVHPDCVCKDNFTCPIDRSFKNGFLPNIDDLSNKTIFKDNSNSFDDLSDELKEALNLFMNKYSLFFTKSDEKIIDPFVELVKSLSGLIATFEIRLRSLPGCLDSKKTKFLSRNLFLTTWYAYRMKGKPTMKTGFIDDVSEDVELKLTVFQRFIKKLIECDELEKSSAQKDEALKQILQSFISSFNETNSTKELCLFLRRVCLTDHFMLKNEKQENQEQNENKIIDWDDIFSPQNLSTKFNVPVECLKERDGEEFEFKSFVFSKMPKEFIRFAQEPYNFPVEETQVFTTFNMIDYNHLILHYDEEKDECNENDYMTELLQSNETNNLPFFLNTNFSKKNFPSVLLCIGVLASKVIVINDGRLVEMRPFYIDRYGCDDIGFRRYQPLFLNEDRYERMMDEILSGDFSNNLMPILGQ